MLNLYCIILTVYLRKLSVATSSYLVLETYINYRKIKFIFVMVCSFLLTIVNQFLILSS